jgi:[methyl-Co(III) methanol-specific corrinoid protein]:coenzyme M methyltransferase
MASAAASTYEVCGFESAVVPFDLCVEAEALGCGVDFQTDIELFMPPVVAFPLSDLPRTVPEDVARAGRIPMIADALRRLKAGIGRHIAIGAWIPGPFTLAWQIMGADAWFSVINEREPVLPLLGMLADFLAHVAQYYRHAGADYITVHEMGGSPQVIGRPNFDTLVLPALTRLLGQVSGPSVLSICGDTNEIVSDLEACGAGALNFDQRNDMARTRRLLPRAVLLGNLDPVGTLSQGTPAEVARAVHDSAAAGVNAIWPGCDLTPEIPKANLVALMNSASTPLTHD